MSAKTITIDIPDGQFPDLEAAASQEGLTLEEFVPRVLGVYLAEYLALKEALEEADRDIAEGRTYSHEEVVANFEARFAEPKKSEAA